MLQTDTFVQSTHELVSAVLQQPSTTEELVMQMALKYLGVLSGCVALAATIAFAAEPAAKPKQDKYTVKVPGGLGFAEFKGYESWQVVSVSNNPKAMAVILGNPAMIKAFEAGVPANGQPVPDGARMAKVHYVPKRTSSFRMPTCPRLSTTWISW